MEHSHNVISRVYQNSQSHMHIFRANLNQGTTSLPFLHFTEEHITMRSAILEVKFLTDDLLILHAQLSYVLLGVHCDPSCAIHIQPEHYSYNDGVWYLLKK